MDAEFSITTDSTLECHDASMWLLHGGLFSVEVLKVEISGVSVISGPISGNGMQIFEVLLHIQPFSRSHLVL